MITICPHCKKEIQISTKQLNKYGFVVGSKGDYISNLITKSGINLTEIITKVDSKFVNQSSIGRILRVLNEMQNKKVIYKKDNKYYLVVE